MTAPDPDARRVTADEQSAQIEELEAAATESAAGELALALAAFATVAAAAWAVAAAGRAGAAATLLLDAGTATRLVERLIARLDRAFDGADVRAERALRASLRVAFEVGLQHGADQAGLSGPLRVAPPRYRPGVDQMIREQHEAARLQLRRIPDDGLPALTTATAVAQRAVTRTEAATAWHVARAAADAVDATASETGASRIWLAERDGCVHCLAYQGETVAAGRPFPGGLTFGDRPLDGRAPVPNPPLHPHCRCVVQLHDPRDTEVVTALKREARRSIVRGFSLPTESEASRLRAADRLLRAGARLPRTVEARAADDVRRGRFGRGRAVPTTR